MDKEVALLRLLESFSCCVWVYEFYFNIEISLADTVAEGFSFLV
jgi:hypothetical protein